MSLKTIYFLGLVILLPFFIFGSVAEDAATQAAPLVNISPTLAAEGRDYASIERSNPWDMDSQFDATYESSGGSFPLSNVTFTNGILSATTNDADAQFFTVYPGFSTDSARSGWRLPIDSTKYHCLTLAARVTPWAPSDEIRVWWFEDDSLAGGTYGVSNRLEIPDDDWHLYTIDLNIESDSLPGTTPWSGSSTWRGLRIDPTTRSGVIFEIDWVRLTNCASNPISVSWSAFSGTIDVWAGKGTSSPDIFIKSGIPATDGSVIIDIQGWEPGNYYIGLEVDGSAYYWSDNPLQIDAAPRLHYDRPSFSSGDTLNWDMGSISDISDPETRCLQYSFQSGQMDLQTPPPGSQPAECIIGSNSDPQIVLNMPVGQVDTTLYRYMSLELDNTGQWPAASPDWALRWLWRTYDDRDPAKWCVNLSRSIPYEPGNQNLVLDLHNPGEGYSDSFAGWAGCHARYWADDDANWLRIDPNENAGPSTLFQSLDRIVLGRVDRVAQGNMFPLSFSSSEPLAGLNLDFYYTTDTNNPTQHTADVNLAYEWDTTSVLPDRYFVCTLADDGLNQVTLCSLAPVDVYAAQSLGVDYAPKLVQEGKDFATQVLSDPWDMDKYSDVSKYINESDVDIHLQNIQFNNGIFSAQTTDTEGQFYTLFPGYQSAINTGKVGAKFPIRSSDYSCFYSRMKVDTSYPLDDLRVFWFEDKTLASGAFGVTQQVYLDGNIWKLYQADLASSYDSVNSNTPWPNRTLWRGIRIDPTTQSGINFQVDWVRLTDCNPINTTISWSPIPENVNVWMGVGQPSPDMIVAEMIPGNSGSYILDVQGWEPGSYYIGVEDSDDVVHWGTAPLIIDPAPLLQFNRPSFTSGESYTWEMDSVADIDTGNTRCVQYTFQNGVVDLITLDPGTIGPGCTSAGFSDPQIVLSMPVPLVDTTAYRYLTFRLFMEGNWQDVNHGWMSRWIWKTQDGCFNVSNDIPFDVGWESLSIDLHDAFEGHTEDTAPPGCPERDWISNPADYLRFDPNENDTAQSMHQQLDFLYISKMDRASQGDTYPIRLEASEDISTLSIDFYYTTNPAVPKQNVVTLIAGSSPGSYKLYLPMITVGVGGNGPAEFQWDTSSVPTGTYYICAEASDGLNTSLLCSQAPLRIE